MVSVISYACSLGAYRRITPKFNASSSPSFSLLFIISLTLFNLWHIFSFPKLRKYSCVMSDGDLISSFSDFSGFRCDATASNVGRFSSETICIS